MKILAIDPGNEQSAWVLYDSETARPMTWAKFANETVLAIIDGDGDYYDLLAVEMVASYGMAVGATVFETCVWTGRFIERWLTKGFITIPRVRKRPDPLRVYRRDVKLHLCGSARAKDSNIRQALIDRYGPGKDKAVGLKASPGPLYGMKADCWSALAVAITAAETTLKERG